MKNYKAVFFDWDGTAVLSQKASPENAVRAMKPLLQKGIKLAVVSGTTIENLAGGRLESYFTKEELAGLYLGLGRGAYNYAFDRQGKPFVFQSGVPDLETLLAIHRICYEIHEKLLREFGYETDIVFSRPNYCKIDLMVKTARGENLFMQANELEQLRILLRGHCIGGVQALLQLAKETGNRHQIAVEPTCDAKYLEVGITSKKNNTETIFLRLQSLYGIRAEDCAFWGDEYVGIEPGIFGSDSFMRTPLTAAGDFFDVSEVPGERPEGVQTVGGGVKAFLDFCRRMA